MNSAAQISTVAPEIAPHIGIDRLEWGKFCSAPNGRINTRETEHGFLGASAGFPNELRSLCDPQYLGISKGQFEEEREGLFEHVKHGTAFRPVIVQDKSFSVFYRIGVRPEDPDARFSRSYSLARYLTGPAGVPISPFSIYQRITPLEGLTRQQAAVLDPVPAVAATSPQLASPDPFLRQALIYLISGVQVHIRAAEEDFFDLVDRVWQATPDRIKILLSAGWNVSSSIAKELAFCCSAFCSESSALYENGRWIPPAASANTSESKFLPGRLYAARFFPSEQCDFERLTSDLLRSAEMPSARANEELPEMPAFHDPGMIARFENAGFAFLEQVVLRQLRSWLETGLPELRSRLPLLVENVQARPELLELVHLGLNLLLRKRGDVLAWFYLLLGKPIVGNSTAALAAGWHRAALLQAAASAQKDTILQSLLDSIRAGEAGDLPDEIVSVIRDLFTVDHAPTHFELLKEAATSTIYIPWACEHAIDLALEFVADPQIARAGTELLRDACRSWGPVPPALEALNALLSKNPVIQIHRETLRRLAEPRLSKLGTQLGMIWDHAEEWHLDRTLLLNWCAGMPVQMFSHPALILANDGAITAEQMVSLLKSGLDGIPQPLWPKMSRAALFLFGKLRPEIGQETADWMPLIRMWPGDLAVTLLGIETPPPAQDGPNLLPHEYAPPDAGFVQLVIEEWLLDQKPERLRLLPQAAGVIWTWLTALKGPQHAEFLAVDICRCLAQRHFEDADLAKTANDQIRLATALVQVSGRRPELARDAKVLWISARKAWQIMFMLDLFPSVDFDPTPAQLAALIPSRVRLQTHLTFHASPERRAKFEIATCDFHEVSFPGAGNKSWRPEWTGSAIAGAYRGASQAYLSLDRALEVYAATDRVRAQVCAKYLAALVGQPDFPLAVSNVVSEFLLPAAMDAGLKKEEFARILGSIQEPGPQRFIQISFEPAKPFERLLDGSLLVADYVIPLLWLIVRTGYTKCVAEFAAKNYALIQ